MKHFIRAGEELCLKCSIISTKSTIPLTRNRRKYWHEYLLLFLSFFLTSNHGYAQTATTAKLTEITPLQIGDTIPEALWHLPLQVINHPDGKDTITLNDYRDKKLIILDFWSTWCGTCIFTLPRTFEKVSNFDEKISLIPITDQRKEIIAPFVVKNDMIKAIQNFYSIVGNTLFMKTFKIMTLPRIVLINKKGVIIAITKPKFITEESLSIILQDLRINLPQKFNSHKISPNDKKESFSNLSNLHSRIADIGKERRLKL